MAQLLNEFFSTLPLLVLDHICVRACVCEKQSEILIPRRIPAISFTLLAWSLMLQDTHHKHCPLLFIGCKILLMLLTHTLLKTVLGTDFF